MEGSLKPWRIKFFGICLFGLALSMGCTLHAQLLYPFGASYFQDRYLMNPAMAGRTDGQWDLDGGYRKESSSVSGSPDNEFLTAAYGISSRIGLGLNLYSDQEGLIRTTRMMGTYAYHVPIDGQLKRLSFGISAGILRSRIDNSAISGADQDDPAVSKFNEENARFDVDFGTAYTDGKLTVEAAFPGMVTFFKKKQTEAVDRTVAFMAAGYVFGFNPGKNAVTVEPRVDYRVVRGFDNVVDAGADIGFLDGLFDISGIYHTSKNATFGAGVRIGEKLSALALYTTAIPSLGAYSAGDFEVGIGLRLGKPAERGSAGPENK